LFAIFFRLSDDTEIDFFETMFEVLPVLNAIHISRVPIYMIIDGPIRNLTTLMYVVAYKRFIYREAYITFDFIETITETGPRFEDLVKNTELERRMIRHILKKYTKLPQNILDKLFEERFFFDSEQCVKYGISDGIIKSL